MPRVAVFETTQPLPNSDDDSSDDSDDDSSDDSKQIHRLNLISGKTDRCGGFAEEKGKCPNRVAKIKDQLCSMCYGLEARALIKAAIATEKAKRDPKWYAYYTTTDGSPPMFVCTTCESRYDRTDDSVINKVPILACCIDGSCAAATAFWGPAYCRTRNDVRIAYYDYLRDAVRVSAPSDEADESDGE
jgi:hypothetical protein